MRHLRVKIDKLEFNWDIILKGIDFVLNENDRISIVWANWVGKTSFLKILIWENKNFEWFIDNIWNLSFWYLNQIYSDNEEKTVLEELRDWFKDILKMENDLENISLLMIDSPLDMLLIEDYTSLLEQFNMIWWYDYNNKIHNVANGIWILDLFDKKLSQISWWQRVKVALCKILLESPDILFLDEPTNFIDMAWLEWLEYYLKNKWTSWYIIVSHDRLFLDKTCNKTYELKFSSGIDYYHCTYSKYVLEREKKENRLLDLWEKQEEYILKQKELIDRFRAWSRAWWAKSRDKMINKIIRIDKPYIYKKVNFKFNLLKESSDRVFYFKEAFIWRKDPLFYISEASLYNNQRVWILGENWVWKSTFLKTIIWELDILDGIFLKWKTNKILYYSQLHEELDNSLSIRQNFIKYNIVYPDEYLISIISNYLFDKNDLDKKVESLSWWQRAKLLFSILSQQEVNVLILDEPTNHLDYDTRETLEKSLLDFKWTILFISHDRYFINKIATHIWFINDWELGISYWNYEDYKFKLENWIDLDSSLYNWDAQLDLVLENKLSKRQIKKMKNKFLK